MIYLIEPNCEVNGHNFIYLNSLLKIKNTVHLHCPVDIKEGPNFFLSIIKYYKELRKQLLSVPKGNISHILFADIYYKIPFVTSSLFKRNTTIVTMHSFPNSKLKKWLMANFFKRVSAVVVHSQYIMDQMKSLGLNNVVYIDYPSFYDYSTLPPKEVLRKKLGIPNGKIVLSALGGIRKDKGLDILLDAFQYLDIVTRNKIILNIAGVKGFLNENDIVNICKKNDITSRLNIRPLSESEFMENVIISDYMVMPYRVNMTGNSGPMTEAMVNGIPCIVPDKTNLGYIVNHYHVGVVFKQEDSKDLAMVIKHVVNNQLHISSDYKMNLTESRFLNKHQKLYSNYIK